MHAKGRRHIFRSLTFSHALHGKYAHLFKSVVRKASSISLHAGRILQRRESSIFVAYISD
jgi:hypothetical protein